jgi:hypothetical protein
MPHTVPAVANLRFGQVVPARIRVLQLTFYHAPEIPDGVWRSYLEGSCGLST